MGSCYDSCMKLRLVVFALALCIVMPACATKKAAQKSEPGMWTRVTHVFHGSGARKGNHRTPRAKHLTFSMEFTPPALKLSDDRRLKVRLVLANNSKKFVQLQFPTTQRIEVIVSDKLGKPLLRWSEDQSFTDDPGYLAINPGERVEYVVSIPTRDMTAGTEYTVEGSVANYPDFKARKIIVPAP